MLESTEPERDSLDAFDEVVDGFGWPVRDVRPMPGDDLASPTLDRSAETANLEWHVLVGEVTADLVDPLSRELRVGVVVDLAHDLLGVPREPHFAFGVALDGWDNTTFRLGDDWSVRLPSADAYVAQVDKEHRWLPVLAKHLSLRIPEPIAIGRPSHDFPRPWSIYRWIEGDPANAGRIASLVELASDLAGFLGELYAIEASGGPGPGPHNFFRGGSIDIWDPETRQSIEFLANKIDARAVTELWERGLGSRWDRAPVWVHGDMAPSNLLVADGRLSAVVDFGCAGIGDPACDLVMA